VIKGGRGVSGGLSAYAQTIGRSKQGISELRAAADVYETVRTPDGLALDGIKSQHLYEVSKAPRVLWPLLVAALVK